MDNNQQQFGSVEETDNDVEYDSGYTWSEWFDYEDTTETPEKRRANIEDAEDVLIDLNNEQDAHDFGYSPDLVVDDANDDSWPTQEELRADLEADARLPRT